MEYKVNESTEFTVPLKNLIAIVGIAGSLMALYFKNQSAIQELELKVSLMNADVARNSEFREKWPRGEIGTSVMGVRQQVIIEMQSDQIKYLTSEIDKLKEQNTPRKRNGN